MKTSRVLQTVAALVATLALAACGGGSESSAASSGSGGDAAQPAEVTIDDLEFQPGEIAVAAGTEVTWTNDDEAPHTVTFDDDAVSSSEQLSTGDTFSATFDEPGTYSYICAVHPDMKAAVTVS